MSTVIDGVDYGPLAQLVGKWLGNKGLDNSPDNKANADLSPYTDELTFTLAGPAENAEQQQLVAVKYHHVIRKHENGQIFHDQIGHWLYEAATQTVMHSLTIPRGVCLLAGGPFKVDGEVSVFSVAAKAGSDTFGIVQSPFMLDSAKTKTFTLRMSVCGDTLSYREVMSLHIYGKDFEHEDKSTLQRVVYDLD
jgi:hypothetical protein